MVTIMVKDSIMLLKLMYETFEIFTEEQLQNLLNKRGRIKISYEDVEQETVIITPPKLEMEVAQEVITEENKEENKEEDKEEYKEEKPKQKVVTKPAKSKSVSKAPIKNKDKDTGKNEGFDASEIIGKLNTFKSEREGEDYLASLKLKKPQLQLLVDYCKLSLPKSTNMKDMIREIVDYELGTTLRSKAVRDKK